MNEKFTYYQFGIEKLGLEVNDDGIVCIHKRDHLECFFPYGSIDNINMKLAGVTISGGKANFMYTFNSGEKKRFEQILSTIETRNRQAEHTTPITRIIAGASLKKNWDSFKDYFHFIGKSETKWHESIEVMLGSMSESEEILYGFQGEILYFNTQRETVCAYVAVITNKKFHYAGTVGENILFQKKVGSVELNDVHALTVGSTVTPPLKYVQFEVKNDDYKLTTYTDVNFIKDVLVKAIEECEKNDNATSVTTPVFSSADELKKFKELLDSGVITQEEFDAKKKQLLGL